MGEENTREHMDRAITKENQEGNKTTDHEDGVANEERAGRKAWNLEGEWQPRHSVMGTQFEEQMVAYDIGLNIFGPGVFGAKVELGNLQEEDQYKESNETHCPLSPIHSSITPTSPTPPCSPTSIPETPSPCPMTDLDSLFAQASRESPRWIFRPTEFAARAGNGTLLALPPIGKVIRPGPLAVQTLSTVFRELGRRTDMPSALVNLSMNRVFIIESHEDSPKGSITLLCDDATAIWEGEGEGVASGMGAFQVVVQLLPKETNGKWNGLVVEKEGDEERRKREKRERWVEYITRNPAGGQAEQEALLNMSPVSIDFEY